ncbi:MAG TPA: hypothetical protein DD490_22290 [Acidobacteria bacterium]|nr:hypothetical protein [Acidobacteriota bacterium]
MKPIQRSSSPASQLIDYWNDTRLHAAAAKSTSVRPAPGIVPWREALPDVLAVGYGVMAQPRFLNGAWQEVRWRTTPSAGALYPFEVIATIVGEGSYLWQPETGRLTPLDARPLHAEELAAAGFVTRPGDRVEALITLVARPWLSMKKYRLRGYGYCHLDVGHTATNLALYMTALGHEPMLHLRFSRSFLAEHLKLEGLCREPLAVLSFSSATPGPDAAEGTAARRIHPASGLELPGEGELQGWETLQGLLSFDFAIQPPAEPGTAQLLSAVEEAPAGSLLALPEGRPPLASAAEWRTAILARRSAKGFRNEPVSLAQLGELLGALRGEGLTADCGGDGLAGLGVRIVARDVAGLTGVFSYDPQRHALRRLDEVAGDPLPACMQQGLAGSAAALVVLHAPMLRRIEACGYSAFAELQFRAAEIGQRLHLAATRLDALAITCIGGFDSEESAALARLDTGEETVYVVLVGIGDDSVFKHDQWNVAFSHGFTSTLED